MFVLLLAGILLGLAIMLVPLHRARRAAEHAREEELHLAQERQLVVDFMHHMVTALGEGLGPADLKQRIVHAAILCSGALSAALFERIEDGRMRSAAVEGLFPPHRPLPAGQAERLATRARFIEQVLKSETFPADEGIVGAVVQTGEPQLVTDADRDPRVVRHEDPALKVRSVIAVPLRFRDSFFGVLAVANSADGGPFTANDLMLLKSLAEQAALALHNAELLKLQVEKRQLDLDLSLASEIQQLLLPHNLPRIDGLDVDARYVAAQTVSGDFYDLVGLSPTRLAVAVADVSGKGIPAAMLMAICRTNLRQIAFRRASPAATLIDLNRSMEGKTHPGMFITMLYAVIDMERSEVTFARAGHELPLFVRPESGGGDRATEFVRSEGMPLGLVPDELFSTTIEDCVRPFARGDALVLYTDGITEAPDAEGIEFSNARLAEAAGSVTGTTAAAMNDALIGALRKFAGTAPPRDDLTLVTIRRH